MKMDESTWPREVTIRATVETARKYLPRGYNEDHEGDDAILHEVGQTMQTLIIHSWNEIPKGYEPDDDEDREKYYQYLEATAS
jgi:hypothetical protein